MAGHSRGPVDSDGRRVGVNLALEDGVGATYVPVFIIAYDGDSWRICDGERAKEEEEKERKKERKKERRERDKETTDMKKKINIYFTDNQ